ncbi:MAG: hypothetical protein ACRDIB_01495 [Ardenticatenaceae bacterium]
MKAKILLTGLFFLALLTLFMLGCTAFPAGPGSPISGSDEPVSSTDPTPTQPPPPSGEIETGVAMVESVDVLILESFPVQIHANVRGNLPDTCTQLGEPEQMRDDNTFTVTLPTLREAGISCAEALTPFETTIPLDVADLPAGEYIVDVNGVTGSFTLQMDNTPLQDGAGGPPGCPTPGAGQLLFVSPESDYCLLYPERFQIETTIARPGIVISGPPAGEGPEAPRATLLINKEQVQEGATLASILDELVANYEGVGITRTPATIGSQPAEIVEGLPGVTGSRIG